MAIVFTNCNKRTT